MSQETPLGTAGRSGLVLAASFGLTAFAFLLLFRIPLGSDVALAIDLNAARTLLAFAAGFGLTAGMTTLDAVAPRPLRDLDLLGLSVGAAAGSSLGLTLDLPFDLPGALAGGAIGAVPGLFLFRALVRRHRLSNLLLLLGLLGAGAVFVLALGPARGHPGDARYVVLWTMGDLSGATMVGATLTLLAIGAVTALLTRALGSDAAHRLSPGSLAAKQDALAPFAVVLVGLAIGAGGIVAFLALVVGSALRRVLAPAGARLALLSLGAAGGASLALVDAGMRLAIGGFAFPLGMATLVLAFPFVLFGNAARQRAEGSRFGGRAFDAIEGLVIGLTAVGLLAFAFLLARTIRDLT